MVARPWSRVKQNKCIFFSKSVEYLGHSLDAEGKHAMSDKYDAIQNAPTPKNVQELCSFLGLLNYYRKFLPNIASILHPLNELLRANQPWEWTSEQAQAFQKAKNLVNYLQSTSPLYNPDLPIKMAADSSAYGIGAVISHVFPDGREKPIAFASRTLSLQVRRTTPKLKRKRSP